jgi:hypothetical protein
VVPTALAHLQYARHSAPRFMVFGSRGRGLLVGHAPVCYKPYRACLRLVFLAARVHCLSTSVSLVPPAAVNKGSSKGDITEAAPGSTRREIETGVVERRRKDGRSANKWSAILRMLEKHLGPQITRGARSSCTRKTQTTLHLSIPPRFAQRDRTLGRRRQRGVLKKPKNETDATSC